jgi:hypothetical protein
MGHEIIVAWILALMNVLSPAHRKHYEPAAVETDAEADARYEAIARAIVRNSFDPKVKPAFGGPQGRMQTALLVTMTFNWESGFRKDVDMGLARTRTAKHGLNDFGRSWCMGQVNLGRVSKRDPNNPNERIENSEKLTPEGWSGRDLVEDRNKCVISTIRLLRSSLGTCKDLPLEERLAGYISGKCDDKKAIDMSRVRMNAVYNRGKKLPKVKDSVIQASFQMPVPTDPATVADTPVAADRQRSRL